jgi:hypothetical protein
MFRQCVKNQVFLWAIGPILLTFSSCNEERTAAGEKEAAQGALKTETTERKANDPTVLLVPAAEKGPYSWVLPKGWFAKGASGMRLATILIPQQNKENLSASVTEFGGGLAGNVNRWRRQVGLPALAEVELADSLEKVETKLGSGYIVALVNPASPGKSMLAAIIPRPSGRSVFLKINGSARSLETIDNDFRSFIRSFSESK